MSEVLGGSYNEVTNAYPPAIGGKASHNYEAHHVYAYNSYKDLSGFNVNHGQGPAIRMDKSDHRLTKSHGSNPGFSKFQEQQRQLLQQGNHQAAWKLGVDDIRNACQKNGKPENTYDRHISQAEKQILKLHQEGKIMLDKNFIKELDQRQTNINEQPQFKNLQELKQNTIPASSKTLPSQSPSSANTSPSPHR
jgi:hypothetical protein